MTWRLFDERPSQPAPAASASGYLGSSGCYRVEGLGGLGFRVLKALEVLGLGFENHYH